ncbi:MAG TPA: hypothetical protein VN493_24805 [Thermoanaerobaculia bacterium]|nr:hypothetical protein [Thermoanaerobaculia bacterium]
MIELQRNLATVAKSLRQLSLADDLDQGDADRFTFGWHSQGFLGLLQQCGI